MMGAINSVWNNHNSGTVITTNNTGGALTGNSLTLIGQGQINSKWPQIALGPYNDCLRMRSNRWILADTLTYSRHVGKLLRARYALL